MIKEENGEKIINIDNRLVDLCIRYCGMWWGRGYYRGTINHHRSTINYYRGISNHTGGIHTNPPIWRHF